MARLNNSIEWNDLSYKILNGRNSKPTTLLNKVFGKAGCELTAIIGPNGSGKTLLLKSLTNRVVKSSGVVIRGNILVNGQPINWNQFAYVHTYVSQSVSK